jgi:hypothetical protein
MPGLLAGGDRYCGDPAESRSPAPPQSDPENAGADQESRREEQGACRGILEIEVRALEGFIAAAAVRLGMKDLE